MAASGFLVSARSSPVSCASPNADAGKRHPLAITAFPGQAWLPKYSFPVALTEVEQEQLQQRQGQTGLSDPFLCPELQTEKAKGVNLRQGKVLLSLEGKETSAESWGGGLFT